MKSFVKIARGLFLLSVCLFFLCGCTKRGSDPSTLKLLQHTSDKALLTVLARQDRWSLNRRTLKTLAGMAPSGKLEKISDTKDLLSAVAVLLGIEHGKDTSKTKLDGLDSSKPIVASLFEPVPGDISNEASTMLIPSMEQINSSGIPGIRHTILLSATNVTDLMRDLQSLLSSMGFEQIQKKDKASTPVYLRWKQKDSFVVLIPEKDLVRVEISQNEMLPNPGEQERISTLLRQMEKTHPKSKATFNSPAWRLVTRGKHILALHIRPWVLRELSTQVGAYGIAKALSYADPSERAMLLAAGMSEVANGFLLMSRQLAETEDVALGLDLEGGLRTTFIAGLTEYGQRLYKAGESKTPFDLVPKSQSSFAAAWNRVDLASIVNSAKPLPTFSTAKNITQAMQGVQECGSFCFFHFVLSSLVGFVHTMLSFLPENVSRMIPRGFAISVAGIEDTSKKVHAGAVLMYDKGTDTSLIQDWLQSDGAGEHFSTEPYEENLLVRVELRMDTSKEFAEGSDKYETNELAGASLDLRKFLDIVVSPSISNTFKQFDTLRVKAWMKDRTLMVQGLLPLSQQADMKWLTPAMFGGSGWSSLAPSWKQTKGQACLAQVTRQMMKAFKSLAFAAPDQKNRLLARAISDTDDPIRCAMQQPDTKAQATKTRELMVLYAADLMARGSDRQAALSILAKGCKQGIKAACERSEKIASKPTTIQRKQLDTTNVDSSTRETKKFATLGAKSAGTAMGLLKEPEVGGIGGTQPPTPQPHQEKVKVNSGKITVMGTLPKEVIRRVIRQRNKNFRYCYEKELIRDPKISGKVMVKFTIAKTGGVSKASVQSTTLKNKPLESCLIKTIKAMKFPKPSGGGIVIISYPFIFRSSN